MRKFVPFLCVFGLMLLVASPLYAGAIVNKSNQSADYFRTLNRNAGTDYADIIVFNPAGTSKMEDGGYLKLDVMYITKDYSNTISSAVPPGTIGELTSDEPSTLPGFFAMYKQGKWAGFFAFTIPGGGGEVKWNQGNARTVGASLRFTGGATGALPQSLIADSVYRGYTLGGSFAINEVWSIAAGVRYIDAYKEATITLGGPNPFPIIPTVVDYEQDADGWSGFIGLNIAPSDALNIGLTYIHKTKLDFETNLKRDDTGGVIGGLVPFLNQGAKQQEDLPGQINAGVSYKFTPKLRVETDLTYYLEKEATWEGRLNGEGNSWEWGLMGEWTFNPQWKASLGYLHSEIDVNANNLLPEAPELTANSIGAGAVFSPTSSWAITFGAVKVFYDSKTSTQTSAFTFAPRRYQYEKDSWSVFAGVQWKFL